MNASSPIPKQRAIARRRSMPLATSSSTCFFTKFCSCGSSARRPGDGFVDQANRTGERVLEDGRRIGQDVDARPAELGQRDQVRALGSAKEIFGDASAEKIERLRDADAFALEHLAAPKHDADGSGKRRAWLEPSRAVVRRCAFPYGAPPRAAASERRSRPYSARRQHAPVADDLAAHGRIEEAPVEDFQQAFAFGVADAAELLPQLASAVEERLDLVEIVGIRRQRLSGYLARAKDASTALRPQRRWGARLRSRSASATRRESLRASRGGTGRSHRAPAGRERWRRSPDRNSRPPGDGCPRRHTRCKHETCRAGLPLKVPTVDVLSAGANSPSSATSSSCNAPTYRDASASRERRRETRSADDFEISSKRSARASSDSLCVL